MKTIILVFLFSVMAFGQSGKSVLTQQQKDSIAAMISDSLAGFTGGTDINVSDSLGAYWDSTKTKSIIGDSLVEYSQRIDAVEVIDTNWVKQYVGELSGVVPTNTIFVGSNQAYTTIQSAINAASSNDVIIIYPGTYTEQVTVTKDLIFLLQGNTIIDYTAASTGATVIINDGINATFAGGKISRTTSTSSSKIIQNAGNLVLQDINLYHSSSSQYTYHLYSTGGSIKADNVDYQNPYYYGGTYLNATEGHISAKNFLGFVNFDSSRVNISADNWFQKWSGFNRSDITGNSIVSFSIKHKMGKLPESGNLDSLYNGNQNGWVIYCYDTADVTFRDGVFALWIYTYGSNKINLLSVHNNSGIPSVRSFPTEATTQYWTMQNSTLSYIPASWDTYKDNGSGNHIFEHTSSAVGYIYLTVDNCKLDFGDPDYQNRDSVRITGNWLQVVGLGKVSVTNTIINEYPNKGYSLAYQPFNYFGSGGLKYYLQGNDITIHGSGKFMGYVPILDGKTVDTRVIDNTITLKDNSSTNNYIFRIAATRNLTTADTIIISGNTYLSDYGNPSLFFTSDVTYWDYNDMDSLYYKLNAKAQFESIETTNLFSRGFGTQDGSGATFDMNNVLNSWGKFLCRADTLSRAGVDGDSLRIRIYLKNEKRTTSGYILGHQMDASVTFYPHGAPSNTSSKNSVYDLRFILNNFGMNNADRDYKMRVDSVWSATYEKCYIKFTYGTTVYSATTNSDDYTDFYVNNLNDFPIELGVLFKQSLNIRKIEVLRF